jgi:hypothetical protein
MAYFIDGSKVGETIRIGWLDRNYPFRTGAVDPEFIQKLEMFYLRLANVTRGWHRCELCSEAPVGLPVNVGGKVVNLGHAEVHVESGDGTLFAAPDLIYHYVTDHNYMPPEDFIAAIKRCSTLGTASKEI